MRKVLAANLARLMAASEDLRTIKQVSARSGVSTGTVDRIRRAEVSAGVDHLGALAGAFSLRPADLLQSEPEAKMPFRDLNTFESQLVTFFRQLTADQQHEVLVALNDLVGEKGNASKGNPFPETRAIRGTSRLGELSPPEIKKVHK